MSHEEVKQVEKAVDPRGELSEAQRNVKAYQDIYDFYIAHDQPEKAAATAMALTLYNRQVTQQAGYMAQALVEKGDMQGAMRWLDKAFDRIPNYRDLEYSFNPDGSVNFTIWDRGQNKRVQQGTAQAEQVLGLSKQLQTGAFFDGQMHENMKEIAAWRGRKLDDKPPKDISEGDKKRIDNQEITTIYTQGADAGKKGDIETLTQAANGIFDRMGRTEEAAKTVLRMYQDAGVDPPASLAGLDQTGVAKTQKDRDRKAQDQLRQKLQGDVAAAAETKDPSKLFTSMAAYADQAYQWQPENKSLNENNLMASMPADLKEDDPAYTPTYSGAFQILKRNDVDARYAAQFMRTLLDPTKGYDLDHTTGQVRVAGMSYPLFVPGAVLTDVRRWRESQKKAP
jgi:hypothetical protein